MQKIDISNIGLAQLEQLNCFINTATTTWNVASNEKIINGIVEYAPKDLIRNIQETSEKELGVSISECNYVIN
ncbi:hypothetical protein B9Z55_007631 [Caenorhabditis nigoni]|nr:hypothetical protein B9Z55_007631 [Caenorhabditis nigoni]